MEAANREKQPQHSCYLLAARAGKPLVAEGAVAGEGTSASGGRLAPLLSPRCVLPRLVAELQEALDYCAERQRQLERSMRVSRRLLRAWYAKSGTTRPGPASLGPSEPLSQFPGLEARPSAHFRVAGFRCSPFLCRL